MSSDIGQEWAAPSSSVPTARAATFSLRAALALATSWVAAGAFYTGGKVGRVFRLDTDNQTRTALVKVVVSHPHESVLSCTFGAKYMKHCCACLLAFFAHEQHK